MLFIQSMQAYREDSRVVPFVIDWKNNRIPMMKAVDLIPKKFPKISTNNPDILREFLNAYQEQLDEMNPIEVYNNLFVAAESKNVAILYSNHDPFATFIVALISQWFRLAKLSCYFMRDNEDFETYFKED